MGGLLHYGTAKRGLGGLYPPRCTKCNNQPINGQLPVFIKGLNLSTTSSPVSWTNRLCLACSVQCCPAWQLVVCAYDCRSFVAFDSDCDCNNKALFIYLSRAFVNIQENDNFRNYHKFRNYVSHDVIIPPCQHGEV